MPKRSAALALVRRGPDGVGQVLLVHPGGPFFAKRDTGAWSLPKGLIEPGEDEAAAARREFQEETGASAPEGTLVPLGEVSLKSGKRVVAFGLVGDFDVTVLKSNQVETVLHGRAVRFPEVDRAEWAALERAKVALNPAQVSLAERALELLTR
jgi:predicted NUDIX family NTP pyrophosphohydrolase